MFQPTFRRVALFTAGGAVAAMTAAGPAAAAAQPAPLADSPNATQQEAAKSGHHRAYPGLVRRHKRIHRFPSRYSQIVDHVLRNEVVRIKCKLRRNGTTWYKLARPRGFVTARGIIPLHYIPRCHHRSWAEETKDRAELNTPELNTPELSTPEVLTSKSDAEK